MLSRTALAAAAALVISSSSAFAQACAGRDLLADMKGSAPDTHIAIRKAADATVNGSKLLWKVEHKDQPGRGVSYLFGTVHLTDDRIQKFSPAALEAFGSVRRVAVEIADKHRERVTEGLMTMNGAGKLLLSGKDKLDAHLNADEQKTAAVALARSGLAADMASRVQPWVAMVMLGTPDCERSRIVAGKMPLDGDIARRAEDRGIGTLDIETVESQFEAMSAVPPAAQVALLKGSLALAPRLADIAETMVHLYKAGDTGAMWPLQKALAKSVGVDDAALDAYYEQVIVERTKRMANRLFPHLDRGGVFIAVGAMHLPGEGGLIEEIKRMGLVVTAVE